MRNRLRLSAAAVALLAVGALGCASDDEGDAAQAVPTTAATTTAAPTTAAGRATTTTAATSRDLVDTAIGAGSFGVLVEAVQAAGLVDALRAPGPLTVFAPTDQAFGAALSSLGITKEALLADKARLTAILQYHVVPGRVTAADVVKLAGQEVSTLGGKAAKVTVSGGTVSVNDARVVTPDVAASNGVIHVIDKVLLPPT
ncbi:MAG: fasciclin domain-containing protein [Acidimicrobiales bacterium]